jgi:hypothetical protein
LANDDVYQEATLLTYIKTSGKSDTYPGDIRHVLSKSQAPSCKKSFNINEAQNTPDNVTVGDVKNYLNKIEKNCLQWSSFLSPYDGISILYWATLHYHHGHMLKLEGNYRFVDVGGIDGHKVIQLRIASAHVLITTLKATLYSHFSSDVSTRKKGRAACRAYRWKAMEPISMRRLWSRYQ